MKGKNDGQLMIDGVNFRLELGLVFNTMCHSVSKIYWFGLGKGGGNKKSLKIESLLESYKTICCIIAAKL